MAKRLAAYERWLAKHYDELMPESVSEGLERLLVWRLIDLLMGGSQTQQSLLAFHELSKRFGMDGDGGVVGLDEEAIDAIATRMGLE